MVQKMLARKFTMNPTMFKYLLNCKTSFDFSTNSHSLLNFITYLAKKFILIQWSPPQIPTLKMRFELVVNLLPLKKMYT